MITLGIHDGHTATAALVRDGRIVACISEERLNRKKEWSGFPALAARECFRIAGIDPGEVDGVGVVGLMQPSDHSAYYAPGLLKRGFGAATRVLPRGFFQSHGWVGPAVALGARLRRGDEITAGLQALGVRAAPVFYEHHHLHAVTGHYASWHGIDENLVLTCDGSGDAVCATVSVFRGHHATRLRTISTFNSIGEFYTLITQYLGMKPMSHEYKVMGLAPYAKADYARETYDLVKDFFVVPPADPMMFVNANGTWRWRYLDRFRTLFAGHRFDNIAWAAQRVVEDVLVRWVQGCVRETGIRNVVLSGGVFLNVKANYEIFANVPEIERLYILPSGGDESLAMGAALLRGVRLGHTAVEPLGPLYLGPEYGEPEMRAALADLPPGVSIDRRDDIDEVVGRELAAGRVVARFAGRMEWGARALGNRSILADPRSPDVLRKINESIKGRDFWMPFAPSILFERAHEYLVGLGGFRAPYMVMAFPTTDKARRDLRGALHPYDFTARPQLVEEEWNAGYYQVLKTFEKATGVGGVLNTSFNLHGDPIVNTPADAVYTFRKSALDGLALGPYYVRR